jgi:hypothetical protein
MEILICIRHIRILGSILLVICRVLSRPDAMALPSLHKELGVDFDDKVSEKNFVKLFRVEEVCLPYAMRIFFLSDCWLKSKKRWRR